MKRSKSLGYSEFMQRFGWAAYNKEPSRVGPPGLDHPPEIRVLLEAARHNCPSAFSQFLQKWLRHCLGVEPPLGVFKPIRYGKAGRPLDSATIGISLLWTAIGCPSLTSTKLAKEYYKDKYATAAVDERKRMVDRLRRAVQRVEEMNRSPTNTSELKL
jgi:hypothetical protein